MHSNLLLNFKGLSCISLNWFKINFFLYTIIYIFFFFFYAYYDIRTGKYITTETLPSHHAMMSMLQISTYPVINIYYSFCATRHKSLIYTYNIIKYLGLES